MTAIKAVQDVKQALIDLVAADAAFAGSSVIYSEPRTTEELRGVTGLREVCYWLPDSSGTAEIRRIAGVLPHAHSLNGVVTMRIEVIHDESDDTRTAVEDRALELADAVITIIEADPEVGLSATWSGLEVLWSTWDMAGFNHEPAGQAVALDMTFEVDLDQCQ